MASRPGPVPPRARPARRRGFARAEGLRRWERHELTKGDRTLRITSLPARHAPGAAQALLPPVMGNLLEFGPRGGARTCGCTSAATR